MLYQKSIWGRKYTRLITESPRLFITFVVFGVVLFLILTLHTKIDVINTYSKASYMSNAKTGDIINTLLEDTGECMHFVIRNVVHLINGILKGIFYMTYIYIISLQAGLVVTLFLPFAVYSTFKFSNKIREHTDNQRELYGGYVSWLYEVLKGLTDIRLLCAEKIIRKDFRAHLRDLFIVNIKTTVSNLSADKLMEFINLLIQLSIFGVCAYLAYNGKITIGSVIVLVSFVFTLKDDTILWLARSFMDAQSRLIRIARIKRFLSEEDESSWAGKNDLVVSGGNIEFRNINFAYDIENSILEDLRAFIEAGSHIAIVGKSGCGKTTIASLLIGMYEAKSGSIFIDGQSITDCNLKSLRQNIGIVQQDVLIFDATIRENLMLGNPKSDEYELWEACRKAGIAEHFENLPEKLDTLIGKEGTGLSGGQRQRLAIARIYLKNPAIIIFDEATSSLDSDTEKIIHEAWHELLQGKTAIHIAHRLSSVMLCDYALLIESGKVNAAGKPSDLIQNCKNFRELFAIKEVLENV